MKLISSKVGSCCGLNRGLSKEITLCLLPLDNRSAKKHFESLRLSTIAGVSTFFSRWSRCPRSKQWYHERAMHERGCPLTWYWMSLKFSFLTKAYYSFSFSCKDFGVGVEKPWWFAYLLKTYVPVGMGSQIFNNESEFWITFEFEIEKNLNNFKGLISLPIIHGVTQHLSPIGYLEWKSWTGDVDISQTIPRFFGKSTRKSHMHS